MPRRRKREDDCGVDTMGKCRPYLMALGHYHQAHSGHHETVTRFIAPPDLQEWPDIFVVSDPVARLEFQELAENVRARQSKGVLELQRMYSLDADPSATQPARRKPRPARRPSGG